MVITFERLVRFEKSFQLRVQGMFFPFTTSYTITMRLMLEKIWHSKMLIMQYLEN